MRIIKCRIIRSKITSEIHSKNSKIPLFCEEENEESSRLLCPKHMISNMYEAEAAVTNNDQFEQALRTKHNDLSLKVTIKMIIKS